MNPTPLFADLLLVRRFLQFGNYGGGLEANDLGQGQELDNVQTTLATFDAGDKWLMPSHRDSYLGLGHACLFPTRSYELCKLLMSGGVNGFGHVAPDAIDPVSPLIGFSNYLKTGYWVSCYAVEAIKLNPQKNSPT